MLNINLPCEAFKLSEFSISYLSKAILEDSNSAQSEFNIFY